MMLRLRLALCVVLACFTVAASAQAAPQKMTVSIAATQPLYAPYFIAQDKGYFAEEGLDVQLTEAAGGVATPALISGSLDVSTSSAAAISASLRGAHIKIVYTLADRLTAQLWATRPELKTLKDLKGLTVGVASRGDTNEIAMRSALIDAGLAQDWVGYTPLGFAGSARLAAIMSGAVPAVVTEPTDLGPAASDGSLKNSHLMIDFEKSLRLPYTGAAVTDALLKSNPGMIEAFLRATIKGVRYAVAFEPETLAIIQKRNPQTDAKVLQDGFREIVPTLTKTGIVSNDLILTDLKVRAAILNIDPTQLRPIDEIYDYTLTRKATAALDQSGWKPTP